MSLRSRRTRVWVATVAVLPALGWLHQRFVSPDVVTVETVRVDRGLVEDTIANSKAGTVRAYRRAGLSAEIGGRVVGIVHREGELVAAGEPLIRLNDASQRARLRLARESLRAIELSGEEACIRRDQIWRDLERKQALAEREVLSRDALERVESDFRAASVSCEAVAAEVDRAAAEVALAEAELAKTVIRAPFDGVVAEIAVELGEWITPAPPLLSTPSVADVIDLSSLYVSAPVDEVDSAQIRVGQPVRISVDSHPGREFAGRLVRAAPYVLDVEAQNRTLEIEVEFLDLEADVGVLPGTSADVEVIRESREAVARIPSQALLEGDRVLVAENGRLVERHVDVGIKNWTYVELRDGLEIDQQVVISLDRVGVEAGARAVSHETEYQP